MYERLIIKKGKDEYKICRLPLPFKTNKCAENFVCYDTKLDNNIIRARSKIFDYACNNDFTYFVTLTFNANYDNSDIDKVVKDVTQLIRDCRKKYKNSFRYILIPEKHKSGLFHLHGFFDSSFNNDFYVNDKSYLSWASFDKFGFSTIMKIRNYEACCKYITKYITKDLAIYTKGKHLYFCSRGLDSFKTIGDYVVTHIDSKFNFYTKFADILYLSEDLLNLFLNDNQHKFVNYYNNITN